MPAKPSIAFHMIRHAESNNNKVYDDAQVLFNFGSEDYDSRGFHQYVNEHRRADPHLSPLGVLQADGLAENYLNPALFRYQASSPVRILCSPMLRTLLTIKPALERLILSTMSAASRNNDKEGAAADDETAPSDGFQQTVHLTIVAFYHEIEGCHTNGKAEPGMTPNEIKDCLFGNMLENDRLQIDQSDIEKIVKVDFVGFDRPGEGWYANGKGHESRVDAEARAAKYCLWLSDYLDSLMYDESNGANEDLFDVCFLLPGEKEEDEQDKFSKRMRRRRTVLAIGHGDFMAVVLKRLVGAYVGCGKGGRLVEQPGRFSHRTTFVHYNTGITELEYFGHSRFIVMGTNTTPHIPPERYRELRSGGTLRDGWAFAVPNVPDVTVEVDSVRSECHNHSDNRGLHDQIQEQIIALKSLYLSSSSSLDEEKLCLSDSSNKDDGDLVRFVAKRGFQVLAVATYSEHSGVLTDVAIRPSGCVDHVLFDAIKQHAISPDKPRETLAVRPRTMKDKTLFQQMGFVEPPVDQNENEALLTIMTLTI